LVRDKRDFMEKTGSPQIPWRGIGTKARWLFEITHSFLGSGAASMPTEASVPEEG